MGPYAPQHPPRPTLSRYGVIVLIVRFPSRFFDRGSAEAGGAGVYILCGWGVLCHAPQHLHNMLHNKSGRLHNMAGNDYRRGKAVLHCVVESWLLEAVKAKARERGVSLTRCVVEILEEVVTDGDVGDRSDDHGLSQAQGGVERSYGGGDCGGDSVSGVVGRVDWDRLLAVGRAAKSRSSDPLEDIA